MKKMRYKVTRFFMGGIFKETSYTEITDIRYKEGERFTKTIGGASYIITSVSPYFGDRKNGYIS